MDKQRDFMLADVLPENYDQKKHIPRVVSLCMPVMTFLITQAVFEIDRTSWNCMFGSGRFPERLGTHPGNNDITLQVFISTE